MLGATMHANARLTRQALPNVAATCCLIAGFVVAALLISTAEPAGAAVRHRQVDHAPRVAPSACAHVSCVTTPTAVPGLSTVKAISAGGTHDLALLKNGTVMAWGDNAFGQLGNGTTTTSPVPVTVSGLHNVKAISAGLAHSLALLQNGTVMAWGDNEFGQLGNGTFQDSSVPVAVKGLTNVKAISDSGFNHGLALLQNGTVMAWGMNTYGQLGDGNRTNCPTPVPVQGLSHVKAVSAGYNDSLALLANSTVMAWGRNAFGQLGNGTTTDSLVPVPVAGLTHAKAIFAGGFNHSLAVLSNGGVMAWGRNYFGQLGNDSHGKSTVPISLPTVTNVSALTAGFAHCLALINGGTVFAWGRDTYGQLGLGKLSKTARSPSAVRGLSNVSAIAAGGNHSLALLANGTVLSWGISM